MQQTFWRQSLLEIFVTELFGEDLRVVSGAVLGEGLSSVAGFC